MQIRAIADIPVSAIGLGGASWSLSDHPAFGATGPPDDERMIQTIHAALDAGVSLIDTARAYTSATHPGHSEAMVARALAAHPAGAETIVVRPRAATTAKAESSQLMPGWKRSAGTAS